MRAEQLGQGALLPFPPLWSTFMPLSLHWVNNGQRKGGAIAKMGRRTVGGGCRVTDDGSWMTAIASVDDWPIASVDDAALGQVVLPAGFEPAERQSEAVGGRERAASQMRTRPPAACGSPSWRCSAGRRPRRSPTCAVPPRERGIDVVQVLRRRGAVLTRPFVTGEDRPTGEWSVRTVGHANVPAEPDHGGRLHRDRRRSEHHAVRDDDLGLLLQDQHHGSARGNHREGRIGRVEHEGATHAAKSSLQPPMRAVRRSRTAPGRTNHTRVILPRTRRVGSAEMPGVANRGRAGRRPAGPARRFTSGQASPPVRRGSPPGNLR